MIRGKAGARRDRRGRVLRVHVLTASGARRNRSGRGIRAHVLTPSGPLRDRSEREVWAYFWNPNGLPCAEDGRSGAPRWPPGARPRYNVALCTGIQASRHRRRDAEMPPVVFARQHRGCRQLACSFWLESAQLQPLQLPLRLHVLHTQSELAHRGRSRGHGPCTSLLRLSPRFGPDARALFRPDPPSRAERRAAWTRGTRGP